MQVKCPKTISGKHYWVKLTWYEPTTNLPNCPRCGLCGIIDDRKVPKLSSKKYDRQDD